MIQLTALVASSAVLSMAVAWVRPVGLSMGARPRQIAPPVGPIGRSGSVERSCPRWFRSSVERSAVPVSAEQAWTVGLAALVAITTLAFVVGGGGSPWWPPSGLSPARAWR